MRTAKYLAVAVLISGWGFLAQAEESRGVDAETAPSAPATAPATTDTAAAPTLSADGQVIKKKMEGLFEASKNVNGATKASARKQIETAMDWDKIASACLGSQWGKLGAGQRAEFRNLLKDVIVRTAYSRMDTFWDKTTYTFDKIEAKGNDAHVVSKFNASGEVLTLDYYLVKKGNDWLVYDISYEDNRYSTNINEQLTAFLREKPFSQLLSNLKKRRDELASGKSTKKSG